MTHYDAGRRFEWKVRTDLERSGYEVIRAAGSKGTTKVDLVALRPGQALFIQCKRDGALAPAEWDHLLTVAMWVDAAAILAVNGERGRGVAYWCLYGPKRPGQRMWRQPAAPFELGHISG